MAGPLLTFGDGVAIDTGRPTLDSSDFHFIFERSSANPLLYSSNEERSAGTKNITPNIPRTQKKVFFIFAKTFE